MNDYTRTQDIFAKIAEIEGNSDLYKETLKASVLGEKWMDVNMYEYYENFWKRMVDKHINA